MKDCSVLGCDAASLVGADGSRECVAFILKVYSWTLILEHEDSAFFRNVGFQKMGTFFL